MSKKILTILDELLTIGTRIILYISHPYKGPICYRILCTHDPTRKKNPCFSPIDSHLRLQARALSGSRRWPPVPTTAPAPASSADATLDRHHHNNQCEPTPPPAQPQILPRASALAGPQPSSIGGILCPIAVHYHAAHFFLIFFCK
jgi:hypothetical protein